MASHGTSICILCRHVTKIGAGCPAGHGLKYMGKHWRAPRRGNDSAWKRIAAGDFLWDKRVTNKHLVERWPWTWRSYRTKRRVGGRIMSDRLP